MTKHWAFWTTVAMTAALGVGTAAAQPDTCFPPGFGVPFDSGPPRFRNFNSPSPAGGNVDQNYDDPRWRGAAALAYTTAAGTANPPVQFRTVWGDDASATAAGYPSTQFLYMQWLIRIGIDGQAALAHDVFLGFERPGAGGLTDGHKRSFMIRLHLGATPAGGSPEYIAPSECSASTSTACATDSDYFEIYEATQNSGATFTCSTLSGTTDKFDIRPPSPATQEWWDRSFAFEKRCVSATPTSCTLWVVSARVPVIPANAAEVESATRGVELGSNFWYQVSLPAFDDDGNPFTPFVTALVDNWPRTPGPTLASNPLCEGPAGAKAWFKDLDSDDGTGVAGPNPWSVVQIWDGNSGTRPSTCFGGIALTPDAIGAMARNIDTGGASVPSDATVLATALGYDFLAEIIPGTRATNLVAAKAINRTGAAITTKLKARFRLAEWGAQPAGSNATWTDIRGSGTGTGVCASGGLPSPLCGDVTLQPAGSPSNADQVVMKFDWTIGSIDGNDATFTLAEGQEYCQYGLTPPTGSGWVCFDNCNLPAMTCDVTTQVGCGVRTDPTAGPSGNPCLRKRWNHQCMLVELDSDGPADIETASTYRNMNIQPMSETLQEATISTGGFAPLPGQPLEEIYLVVMPRNMPSSIPATNGLTFLQDKAAGTRDRLLRPYVEAAARLTPEEIEQAAAAIGRLPDDSGGMEPEIYERVDEGFPGDDLPVGAELMPRGSRRVAEFLDGLSRYDGYGQYGGESYGASGVTNKAIDVLDDVTATEGLSTLDIYVFRKVKMKLMVPMSSFTLVVHHEGPLHGITWEIDGAVRIRTNLFKVVLPNAHQRKIRIRAMAKETATETQTPGDPSWPCSGNCNGNGNGHGHGHGHNNHGNGHGNGHNHHGHSNGNGNNGNNGNGNTCSGNNGNGNGNNGNHGNGNNGNGNGNGNNGNHGNGNGHGNNGNGHGNGNNGHGNNGNGHGNGHGNGNGNGNNGNGNNNGNSYCSEPV